ncbi:cbb3-type cytochrome oxidase assembly protein CcoS [Pontibacter pudoricolor]|uniref:cbb3-type cytochrome oxidase assembly protein CcoS n=1 Tax=Pontibacter pudoricolor TaxID=2694930 RepID=UPI001390B46D|nr:cbb3-type cytochrome oxidase assembly protein CcoS [Pontibacter pudoricolor]
MYIIFLMIAVSVTVATAFLLAFLWAVRSGQYDDDYTPAVRMLFDNEVTTKSSKKSKEEQSIGKSLQP